jgi:tRNA(adenine34) deaminase
VIEGLKTYMEDKDRYYLEMALGEAEQALKENTYPIGA